MLLFVPMVGTCIGGARMMVCPHIMLSGAIPPAQTGIYIGI